jgi:hypothetical protein
VGAEPGIGTGAAAWHEGLARHLPFDFPERLAVAALHRDMAAVDAITDELAKRYPHLVRRRGDGGRFESAARARQRQHDSA